MRYLFDDFILDLDRFALLRDEVPLPVEPQVLELLHLLIANSRRMVSKEEIFETVWKGRFVSEAALSSRIKSARQALGDDGKLQNYIRTVHKKGFQFIRPILVEGEGIQKVVERAPEPAHLVRPRILVLPFENLSSDPEQDYFVNGMTGDIITHLSHHKWLDVIASNTAFGFKGQSVDLSVIREQLQVDYLVGGAVQRGGSRVRVNVHLVSADNGAQLWSDRHDGEIEELFDFQDAITEKIVARLEPEIGFAERKKIINARPSSLKAWDCYQLGVHHFFKFTGEDNLRAQQLLAESQKLDENFGEAYAWWAYAVVLGMVYWTTSPTQDLLDRALAACNKALELNPHNATFYALRARVLLARGEYETAIRENEIAISLNPTFAAAYCGLGDSLAYEARYQEATNSFEKAIELSPNDPQLWAFLTYGALAFIFQGENSRALQWLDRAQSIPNCQYWARSHKIVALVGLGRQAEAESLLDQLCRDMPEFSCDFVREKLFYIKREEQIEYYLAGLGAAGLN